MSETLIYIVCGAMGVIGHTLLEYSKLNKQAISANIKFGFTTYLQQDWVPIALSFVAVGIWLFLFEQAAEKYPLIKNYTRGSFVLCGYFGASLIQYVASKAQEKITSIVDIKTTLQDKTEQPISDINSAKQIKADAVDAGVMIKP